MSGGLGRLAKLPTILRTVMRVRPRQAFAQVEHMVFGLSGPTRLAGPAPSLAPARDVVPFLPPPSHIRVAEQTDHFDLELLGKEQTWSPAMDWVESPHGPLVAYHLHEQAYLRHEALSPALRARVIEDWMARHEAGVGWDPHPISLRLLSWGKLLLTPGALPEAGDAWRQRLCSSMADQAETLLRGLEVRLQANHLLSNRLSVVFAGLLFEGDAADRWRSQSSALVAEIEAQVHPDGGHEERSPMYHSLILENLLDLLNVAKSGDRASASLVESLTAACQRMLHALAAWTRPDGRIGLLGDSAFGVAAEPEALFEYAASLGVVFEAGAGAVGTDRTARSTCLPQTGVLRLVDGDFDLLASVSGPAPRHQPGHAHCDALSFELSMAGRRVVADTGLFEYRPGRARDEARATAGHATLSFDGAEQAEVWAAHRIGGRPQVQLRAWDEGGEAAAECRGWSRGAPLHERRYRVTAENVEIADRVVGDFGEAISRIPIHPDWQVALEGASAEGGAARARLSLVAATEGDEPDYVVLIDLPGNFDWQVETGPYFPTFHTARSRSILVGRTGRPVDSTIRLRFER